MKLTAGFEKVDEGYIAFVEELAGAKVQAATIGEARPDPADAVVLALEANRSMSGDASRGRNVTRKDLDVPAPA